MNLEHEDLNFCIRQYCGLLIVPDIIMFMFTILSAVYSLISFPLIS